MEKLTALVLARRNDAAFRSEVGRGRAPSTEAYAYRHLAFIWSEFEGPVRDAVRRSTLLWAAECCDNIRIPQSAQRPFGQMVALLGGPKGLSRDGLETRLLAVQRQDLVSADHTLRTLFSAANQRGIGVDWWSVERMYAVWDHSDLTTRRKVRRRVLEDFYSHSMRTVNPDTGAPDVDLEDVSP